MEDPKTPDLSADTVPPESGEDDAATKVSELPADLMDLGPPPEPFVESPPAGGFPPPAPAAGLPPIPRPRATSPLATSLQTSGDGYGGPNAPAVEGSGHMDSVQVRPAASSMDDESIDTSAETHLTELPADVFPRPAAVAPSPHFPAASPFAQPPPQMPQQGSHVPQMHQGPPAGAARVPPQTAQGGNVGASPFAPSQHHFGGMAAPNVIPAPGGYPLPPPPFAKGNDISLTSSGILWAIGGIVVGLVLVALIVLALYHYLGAS